MNQPIYTARSISKSFGTQPALRSVDIDVYEGRILGLIGANGAGKSTLMKILSGALAADDGELLLANRSVRMTSMLQAWRAGVAFVSQELNLFPPLSIAENVWLVPGRVGLTPAAEFLESAAEVIADLGLEVPLATPVSGLSLGDRQLVEIARAIVQEPRVLILDEPTSALRAAETDRLHQVLRKLADSGVAIVYISHFLEELLDITDSVVVLRDGMRVPVDAKGCAPTIGEIVTAMLGAPMATNFDAARRPAENIREDRASLRIRKLKGPSGLSVESLTAHASEVVGIAGLAGAGVEALFGILFGLIRPVSGSIQLPSGKPYRADRPSAVANGVAYLPADRKRLGLTLRQSVYENVVAVRSLALGRDGIAPSIARQKQIAQSRCAELGVKMHRVEQSVGSLSGGNQQKVVFARWLEAEPSLLLLDDPMRGIDVNAKREMYRLIRDLAASARVILFYSSDAADYISVCDRVLVFVDNTIGVELEEARLNEHALIAAMNGEGA